MSSNQLSLPRSAKCALFFASMMLLWMGCGGDDENDAQSQAEEENNAVVGAGTGGVSNGTGGAMETMASGGAVAGAGTGGNMDTSPASVQPDDVQNQCVAGVMPCGAGSTCRVAAIDAAEAVVVANRCFADNTPTIAEGEVCIPWSVVDATEEDPEAELDPCDEGLGCTLDVESLNDDVPQFICQPLCPVPGDENSATSCGAERVCNDLPSIGQTLDGAQYVCSPLPSPCDLIAQTGCEAGEICRNDIDRLTTEIFTRCVAGTPGAVEVGGSCGTGANDICEPASRCIAISQNEGQCSPLCRLAECADISEGGVVEVDSCEPGLAGCPENFRCQPLLFNNDGESPPYHPTIAADPPGICIPVAP